MNPPDVVMLDAPPLPLARALLPGDERIAAGTVAVATTLGGHTLARAVMAPDAWPLLAGVVRPDRPCAVRYVGTEADPGVHAALYALVPRDWLLDALHDADEAWRPGDELVGLLLGVVVRFDADRKYPHDFAAECADHFAALLDRRGVDAAALAVDRVIAGL